jgi:hypothetical protein
LRGVVDSKAGLKAHPDEIAPYRILPAAVDAVENTVLARLKLFNA